MKLMLIRKLVGFVLGLAIAGLHCLSANALTPQEFSSNQYLDNHGYSPEVIRMVNIQKSRTEDTQLPAVYNYSKVRNLMRNLYKSNIMYPLTPFGSDKIEIDN